jgi:hypothetical protein
MLDEDDSYTMSLRELPGKLRDGEFAVLEDEDEDEDDDEEDDVSEEGDD